MGTTVIGGMFAACAIAIFLIPVSFCLVERLVNRRPASVGEGGLTKKTA
jgi:hypothetical protein